MAGIEPSHDSAVMGESGEAAATVLSSHCLSEGSVQTLLGWYRRWALSSPGTVQATALIMTHAMNWRDRNAADGLGRWPSLAISAPRRSCSISSYFRADAEDIFVLPVCEYHVIVPKVHKVCWRGPRSSQVHHIET